MIYTFFRKINATPVPERIRQANRHLVVKRVGVPAQIQRAVTPHRDDRPQIFVLTTDAYYDDLPYSGLDFSENNDVSSGDSNADTYLSFSSSQISINGADNIQESSKTDMQSVTEAPTTGYGDLATVDITDEDSWGYYPDHYNRVYIAITKEGHYVKFKLLPSCNGSGDNGSFRCFDVLYSYQSDTSANFSY